MAESIRVSVVAPVYNAELFLSDFIGSFLHQSLPSEAIELIAVDDGSTDRSGIMLDEFAADHPNIRVIHQENSGWPGKPRNVGLGAARGDYVFFADPDDELGAAGALERLAEFADKHSSDVVVPKIVTRGRPHAQWRYKTTQIDADLVTCFTTLTPHKLFRRTFLLESGIRFPEQKTRLEDGQMLSRAYLQAARVSILSGYDFYYLIHHPEQNHLSSQPKDPAEYINAVCVMSSNVEEYCEDEDTGDRIINEIYLRKVLHNLANSRWNKQRPEHRQAWLDSQQRFIERFINTRRYDKMNDVARTRTDLVRTGDMEAIADYVATDSVDFSFTSASSKRGRVTICGDFDRLPDNGTLPSLVVTSRQDDNQVVKVPFERENGDARASIPKSALPLTSKITRYNLSITPGAGHPSKRFRGPEGKFAQLFSDDREVELYTTKAGNLSVKVSAGLRLRQRLARRVKRLLRR
ncbi:glycosyltransferase family 2 protein [Brevibacterium sp. GP-SGM9]|uniref:glycosyltransferase family 2 protein n=1 Tax=Brevibacterium sp. GP-SGM9 TaxID=3376990 RepID=UPI0039A4D5D3